MKKGTGKRHRFRWLKYILLSILSFILLLVLIAGIFEKKIAELAFEKVKEDVDLPVSINKISFTLLRSFPLATIELSGVTLGSPVDSAVVDTLQNLKDTLISVDDIYFSVEALPLTDGIFDIKKVDIEGIKVRFFRDKNGSSNFDFLMDTTSTESGDTVSLLPDITLQGLSLKDMTCYYSDSTILTRGVIYIPELKVKGKVKKDIYSGSVKGIVNISGADFGDTNLDRMRNTRLDFDLVYVNDSLSVNNFLMVSDGIRMTVTGIAVLKNKVFADVNISSEEVDLAEMKKYVPDDTLKKYGIESVAGNMLFNVKIRGIVSDTVQMPSIDADLWLKNGNISVSGYPAFKNVSFNAAFTNGEKHNEKTSGIRLKNFHFETNKGDGDISAYVKNFDDPAYRLKGAFDIDLSEIEALVPDPLIKMAKGNVNVNFSTKGVVPDSVTDKFINDMLDHSLADISFRNVSLSSDSFPDVKELSGSILYRPGSVEADSLRMSVPDYQLKLENCSFNAFMDGPLTEPTQTILDVRYFLVQTDKSRFAGNLFIKNLESPEFRIDADMVLDLAEAASMLPDDSLVIDVSGLVSANVRSSGHLAPDSLEEHLQDVLFRHTELTAELRDVTVAMPDTMMCVDALSGNISLVPGSVMLENVAGNYKTMSFHVPGMQIDNLYKTVLQNKKDTLTVKGEFELGDVDYALFAPFVDDTLQGKEETEPVNYSFLIKGKCRVNSIKYEKAVLKNISALYKLTDSLYIVDKLKFGAFGGKADNSVRYELQPDGKAVINTKHLVEDMDIHKLLFDFDSFKSYGNNEIEADNLAGLLSTDLHTKIVMDGDSLIENETRIKGDMKLKNGGIYNYKAAMDMAEFTKLKELDSIRFKTFDSKIFMFKGKLYVPKTYIVSSALDIGFFGMQSIGEDYEYHIQLHLGDVLKGKSQRLLKRQAESGDEVTSKDFDRSTVKLLYANINGKSKVGFDKKKRQMMMQVKIKTQEKMLNLIFFPKLVSFDTGIEK